jgi:hypothetical protein
VLRVTQALAPKRRYEITHRINALATTLPVREMGGTNMRLAMTIALAVATFAVLGCAGTFSNPSGKKNALEESQRRYTELVRWGEIERASAFVDPEVVDAFLDQAVKIQNIRFTDFESGPPRYADGNDSASVTVVYHAYSLKTLVEKQLREKQEWYRDGGPANNWRVRPALHEIVAEVFGSK